MNKKAILIPLFGIFAYVTLSSDSGGPGGNKTGSHGVVASCGTCHGNAASAGLIMAFELDSAGTAVTRYKPGMLYTLKMTSANTTTSILPKYGMQLSVVKGGGSSSTNAGIFSALPTSTNTFTFAGISILQHNAKLSPASGTGATGTTYVVSVGWTAPAAGTGTITAYGVLNAVNNDGDDNTLDKWNTGNASFTELTSATAGIENVAPVAASIYPNPVSNVLHIDGYTGIITIFDINGKVVTSATSTENTTINTVAWQAGVYLVALEQNGMAVSRTIVKQ